MIRAVLLTTVLLASAAFADDAKYKAMDAARIAIVAALDTGDATSFATFIPADGVVTDGLWFTTPACRKKFSAARVTAKTAAAFVACFKPLGVTQGGLLVLVGPGITMSTKIDVTDGKATLTSLKMYAGDPPEVFARLFEQHRTAGDDDIDLPDAARAELDARPGKLVAFRVCVNAKGAVTKTHFVDIDEKGALATAIVKGTRDWKFKPFTIRTGAIPVCGMGFMPPKRGPS